MITLSILIIIWGIISFFKIKACCLEEEVSFNPFYAPFWAYMGFIFSLVLTITVSLWVCVKYLP
jgi:hypothetical protein